MSQNLSLGTGLICFRVLDGFRGFRLADNRDLHSRIGWYNIMQCSEPYTCVLSASFVSKTSGPICGPFLYIFYLRSVLTLTIMINLRMMRF